MLPAVSFHRHIKIISRNHLLYRNMQQIIQPLIQPETDGLLLQRRVTLFHHSLHIIRIPHDIHKYPGKIIPILFPRIAPYPVIYMIQLAGQDTDA